MNIICTSIEQSKKLIELGIDVNSADMYWSMDEIPFLAFPVNDIVTDWKYAEENGMLPAWSLAALLDIIPEGVTEKYYAPNIQKENGIYTIAYGNDNLLCIADNPVDACYEMILKLYELKLL